MSRGGWMKAFQFFGGTGIGGWGTQNFFKPNSATNIPPAALGIDFQGAQYGPPITVLYGQNSIAGNVIWYGDFTPTAETAPGGKGGGGSAIGYSYTASFLLALCEGPVVGLVTAYDGTTSYTPGNGPLNGNFFKTGTSGQAAWSHLSGAAALGYDRTCLWGFQNYQLNNSPTLPNLNFEVAGLKQFGSGIVDANPSDILTDICTDANHGINFPNLGTLTQYSNYCVANGLFLSPVYNTQSTGQQALSDLFKYTNTEAFYSENQLKVVPRGDTSVTGNGATFTPVRTIQYQFDVTNILTSNKGEPLVTIDRKSPADCRNVVRFSFNDRAFTYSQSSAIASIDYDVLANGARAEQDESYAGVTTASVAKLVAQNLVQQAFYVRNTYTWKVPWRFCDLEPMDLVEVSDPDQGLVNEPVRVTSVEEDEYGVLTIIGEEYPEGIGYAVMFPVEPNVGFNLDTMSDPGAVQAPYIVRGPGLLVPNNSPEIWVAVTGTNALWGGCTAYISYDGTTYHAVSQIARQGLYGIVALPVWAANNVQVVGQLIQDPSGNTQRVAAITSDAKTGGSAPSFANTVGTTTTDNHVTWVCVAVKLPVPAAPSLTDTAGGALLATTYFSFCTWVDAYGRETPAGAEASHVTSASRLLNVAQPASPPTGAVSWRVYVSNTAGGGSGHETLQVTNPIATVTWVEPASGLIAGTAAPGTNTTGLFSLPAGTDPDTVNIPRVYLYRGQLLGGTQTDADNFATLSMLDTELLSYETATLASDGGYDLSYIRRGGYNSSDVAHISGAPFMRMDSNIIRVPVDPSLIGTQVWFKFLSVNVFNKTPRTLAGETAYTYIIGTNQETPDVPPAVTSLTATASTDMVLLSWANPSDLSVYATSIEYAPTWEPLNTYALNFTLYDVGSNTTQQVTVAGTSSYYPVPTFSGTIGTTTTDGSVTWKCIAVGPIAATNLGTPATPMIAPVAGTLPSGTHYFKITFLDQYGLESLPSAEVVVTTGSTTSYLVTRTAPDPVGAVAWNIYYSATSGGEDLLTNYTALPLSQNGVVVTNNTRGSITPPTFDHTAQGGFTVLHNVGPGVNHYKFQQAGDQEYAFRIRQRGYLAQAGWGQYSAPLTAPNANAVRKNSKLGSANMLLDPNFSRSRSPTDSTFWTLPNTNYTIVQATGVGGLGIDRLVIQPASYGTGPWVVANEYVPCKAGDTLYSRCQMASGSTTGAACVGVQFYDNQFNVLATNENVTPASQMAGTFFTTFGFFTQAPANAKYARFTIRGGNSGGTLTVGVNVTHCFLSIQDYAYGSTPSSSCNTTLTYTSTTTSVNISFTSFSVLLPDGTSIAITNGSTGNITGLTAGHTYYAYPYLQLYNQLVAFSSVTGHVGSEQNLYNSPSILAVQVQNNLNNFPMSTGAMTVSTPASGTGSGSGGGSSGGTGGCLHGHDTVRARIQGHVSTVHADMLEDGDELWTPKGWLPIKDVRHAQDYAYLAIVTSEGQSLIRTGQHLLYDHKGREIRVDQLRPGMLLDAENGRVRIKEMRLEDEASTRVSFTIGDHIYFAMPGGVREHNTNAKP